MEMGIVSMRNEDGTQWYMGDGAWSPARREAVSMTRVDFEREFTEKALRDSRRNDCPDNGFMGIYELSFRPIA